MALRPTNWLLRGFLFPACLVACSASEGDPTLPPATGGTPSTATGGAPAATGGAPAATTGGFTATTGGVPNLGTGGATGGVSNVGTGGVSQGTGGATGGVQQGQGGGMSTGGASGGSAGKASGGTSMGGSTGGSKATGGAAGGKATGGATGGSTGGAKATGGVGTGGATNTGAGPTVTCGCTKSAGEFSGNPIGTIILVDGGEVYDGKCMTFRASNALGDGSQAEGQDPILNVNNGTVQNLLIGNSAADGIHVLGNTTIKNVHWLDIGEDAMSIGSSVGGNPTVNVDCGSSAQGSDKTFQVNAQSTWNFKNFTAKTAGKFMRQNGGSTFKMTVSIDHCDIADMSESIYRTDSTSSIINLTNTRYHNVGNLFYFGTTKTNDGGHAQVGDFSGNVSY